MKLLFRTLEPNEIECRVGSIKENGLSLLLYKDARCDMNMLDEVVGALNWQKSYELIDGQLFCTISIYDEEKKQWVSKQDVGTESNTEAEKGRASDAQKRAATAWGIGRELYTAPFIWIDSSKCNIRIGNNCKKQCMDRFSVAKIKYDDCKNIVALAIVNETTRKLVFTWQEGKGEEK